MPSLGPHPELNSSPLLELPLENGMQYVKAKLWKGVFTVSGRVTFLNLSNGEERIEFFLIVILYFYYTLSTPVPSLTLLKMVCKAIRAVIQIYVCMHKDMIF